MVDEIDYKPYANFKPFFRVRDAKHLEAITEIITELDGIVIFSPEGLEFDVESSSGFCTLYPSTRGAKLDSVSVTGDKARILEASYKDSKVLIEHGNNRYCIHFERPKD